MNSYLKEFGRSLEQRFSDDATNMSMSEWMKVNTRLKKKPFSFLDHEFQVAIADDMHTDMSCIKCSQVGLTEIQIRKFLAFLKRTVGVNAILTLPTDKMRDRVSQTRILPMVNGDAVFNSLLTDKPVRSKGIVQVDQSFGYMTGSSEGDATSIAADMLLHDEVDLTDQQILGLFQSRLQHSSHRIRQRFSTPTFLGYGIDASYEISDQREYTYRCPSCNHWQIPKFSPQFMCLPGLPTTASSMEELVELSDSDILGLDFSNGYMCCSRCRSPLDLTDPSLREWVTAYPGRSSHGYRVRPHCVSNISLEYIFTQLMEYRRLNNIQGFWNTVLGESFNDSNVRISEADIRACMLGPGEPEIDRAVGYFIGIDVGQTCHITVGNMSKVVRWLQVPVKDLIETTQGIQKAFNIIGGAIDLNPYRPLAEELFEKTDKVVVPMAYATHPAAPFITQHQNEFEELTHCVTNRTMALDAVARSIRTRNWGLCGYGTHDQLVVDHIRDMIRIEKADVPPIWQKLKGNDHFLHSLALLQLANRFHEGSGFRANPDRRTTAFIAGTNLGSFDEGLSLAQRRSGFLPLQRVQ